MTDLQVFHDGFDWVIAKSAEDAAGLVAEMRGDVVGADEFAALPPDETISVLCNEQGKPDDYGVGIAKTAAEWVAQEGRSILCSRDF